MKTRRSLIDTTSASANPLRHCGGICDQPVWIPYLTTFLLHPHPHTTNFTATCKSTPPPPHPPTNKCHMSLFSGCLMQSFRKCNVSKPQFFKIDFANFLKGFYVKNSRQQSFFIFFSFSQTTFDLLPILG